MEQASFFEYVLFSWFIWGMLFIIVGLVLFGQTVFDISTPIVKLLVSVLLVYCGVWVLVCGFGSEANRHTLVFNEAKMTASKALSRFRIVFSRGTVDLAALQAPDAAKPQNVDILFGWGALMLDAGTPALVNVNSVFSSISMPGMDLKKKTGSVTYVSQAYQDETQFLPVRVRVWFGELKIFEIEKKKEEGTPPAKADEPEAKEAA